MAGFSRRAGKQNGFTLIEMVLTMSLLAILLPFLMLFVVSIGELWIRGTEGDFFPEHVDGVTRFLEQSFERAEAIVSDGAGGEGSLPVEWARPPGFNEINDPLLLFRQSDSPALLTRQGRALPNINAYLFFEPRSGLSLLWYSDHDESVEDRNDLYRTELSPYVSDFAYCYYDADNDRWDIVDDPEEDNERNFLLPQYLRLTFSYEDQTVQRHLLVPQRNPDVPVF